MVLVIAVVPWINGSAAGAPPLDQPRGALGRGLEVNASRLSGDQSEPSIAVAPRDPSRIVAAAIDFGSQDAEEGSNLYISSDGGRSWNTVASKIWADPSVVADSEGSFWVSGVEHGVDVQLVRIANGGKEIAGSTRLPRVDAGLFNSDKPSIHIDDSPTSPTQGRLYAVWMQFMSGGYLTVVLTYCDTRVEGDYVPERCDAIDNWAAPFPIVPGRPQVWGPDLAIGPEGEVYIVWADVIQSVWTTIRGATCAKSCTDSRAFTTGTVVTTNATREHCFPAGRRIRQTPSIEVDTSRGRDRGRVFIAWIAGSLSPAPGGCNWTYDAFIASGDGRLPEDEAGTPIYVDEESDSEGRAGSPLSDEFFPNVAVDPRTGATWVSFYSTRLDPEKRATNLYVRKLTGAAASPKWTVAERVSSPIDLSEGDADNFFYGDYAGLDVVRGWPYPVWVNHGDGKDIFTWIPARSRR